MNISKVFFVLGSILVMGQVVLHIQEKRMFEKREATRMELAETSYTKGCYDAGLSLCVEPGKLRCQTIALRECPKSAKIFRIWLEGKRK
jgi:hypothetical protein